VDSEGRRDGMEDTFSLHGCGPSASRTLFNARAKTDKNNKEVSDEKISKSDRSSKSESEVKSNKNDVEDLKCDDAQASLQIPRTDLESGQVICVFKSITM
jgi:hypothetical protein